MGLSVQNEGNTQLCISALVCSGHASENLSPCLGAVRVLTERTKIQFNPSKTKVVVGFSSFPQIWTISIC